MNKYLSFDVPGIPVPKGRPRVTTRGKFARMYTPPKTAAYELSVATYGGLAMHSLCYGKPFTGVITLGIGIILPIPDSWSKKKKAEALIGEMRPVSKPDLDNIIKVIGDGLNGIVWEDDSQICDITARKRYGLEPKIIIKIESEE